MLSTCNRVEVYADTGGFHAGVDAISDLLARASGVPLEDLGKHLYVHWEGQAVLHLFQVACGLDSMVVGESQILGQLRRAYAAARDGGTGPTLHQLFQKALAVGKRAHSETGIDEAGRSLVTVGLDRAVEAVGPLDGRRVLVVGAGSMGALAGATMRRAGAGEVVVANRTLDRAKRLAEALEGRGIGLDELDGALVDADVVVTSTGATGVVVDRATVERAVAERGGRPLALLDLALPHDVDPSVRDLPGVTLVDLALAAAGARRHRRGRRRRGRARDRHAGGRRVPGLAARREHRADRRRAAGPRRPGRRRRARPPRRPAARRSTRPRRARSRATVRRVVEKLLHTPTVRVKELHDAPEGLSYAEALRELFGLDRAAPAAVTAAPLSTVVDDELDP